MTRLTTAALIGKTVDGSLIGGLLDKDEGGLSSQCARCGSNHQTISSGIGFPIGETNYDSSGERATPHTTMSSSPTRAWEACSTYESLNGREDNQFCRRVVFILGWINSASCFWGRARLKKDLVDKKRESKARTKPLSITPVNFRKMVWSVWDKVKTADLWIRQKTLHDLVQMDSTFEKNERADRRRRTWQAFNVVLICIYAIIQKRVVTILVMLTVNRKRDDLDLFQ